MGTRRGPRLTRCTGDRENEATQSKRSQGKDKWSYLLAVANDVVEVATNAGRAVGNLPLLTDLLRRDQLDNCRAVGGEDLDALIAKHPHVGVVAAGALGCNVQET